MTEDRATVLLLILVVLVLVGTVAVMGALLSAARATIQALIPRRGAHKRGTLPPRHARRGGTAGTPPTKPIPIIDKEEIT